MKRRIDYASVAARYREGERVADIATSLGVTRPTVYRALRLEGVEIAPRRGRYDPDAVVAAYANSQLTIGQVAARIGCSYSYAQRVIHDAGVVENRRSYPPRFDHAEARRLHDEEGLSACEISRRLGVSNRSAAAAINGGWRPDNRCVDCGAEIDMAALRCSPCDAESKVKRDADGNLYCTRCETWKPEDGFYRNASRPARGRSSSCRACNNLARRTHRQTHPEVERAAVERQAAKRWSQRAEAR